MKDEVELSIHQLFEGVAMQLKSPEDACKEALALIQTAQVEAVRAALQKILDNSSGGGSWRRNIIVELDRLANLKEDTSTTTATMPLPEIPLKEDGETE